MAIRARFTSLLRSGPLRITWERAYRTTPARESYRMFTVGLDRAGPVRPRMLEIAFPSRRAATTFSLLDEETIIARYLGALSTPSRTAVDIGAGDGTSMSNTFSLFKRGYAGLAVECDAAKFARLSEVYRHFPDVVLGKFAVTPHTIVALLDAAGVPDAPDFLSLDIDGYDRDVLTAILSSHYRPRLLCLEINEKIPPPLRFAVRYHVDHRYTGDHFYGQSIAELHTVCSAHAYDLVALEYNNAFLMPRELGLFPALSAADAYRSGYLDRKDRKERFPWNADMERLMTLPPQEAMAFVQDFFARYEGQYDLSLA